jgi:UDP-glucose 4-epimerase
MKFNDRKTRNPADLFDGKNVLITGGLGFIGSNLAIELVHHGANVTLLDSLLPQFGGNQRNIALIRDRVAVNISDMRDVESLEVLVQEKDFIFNLAGQVSHGDSMRDPKLDLEVNCVSTMNLVEACRKYNSEAQLLYTSTRQVYGRPQGLPVTEDHPTHPIDVNGINKLAAEYYHLLYHEVYGIRSTVLRLTNTYGPRQRIDTDRQGAAAVFIQRALAGRPIQLYGSGRQQRDFNYIDDVVEAMLLAIGSDECHGKVFNLGARRPHSLTQFARILEQLCGCAVENVPFPDDKRLIDIGDYYGNFSRFTRATGWEPKIDLPEGLRRTVAFFRRDGRRPTHAVTPGHSYGLENSQI